MTDKEVISKMNKLCKLSQELTAEAKSRYGDEAQLFLETNILHFTAEVPDDGGAENRQSGIKLSATEYCDIESGAW